MNNDNKEHGNSLSDLSEDYIPSEEEKKKLEQEAKGDEGGDEDEKKKLAEEEAKQKQIEEDQKAADNKAAEEARLKEEEERIAKEASGQGNPNDDDFDWSTVNKLVGVEIDIKELEIEPTPQGAAKYANAVVEKKLSDFEETLEKKYPREYEALQLAIEGKDPSILYKQKEEVDYSTFDIKAADVDTQKEILTNYYLDKGLSKEKTATLVKMAEDDGKLKDDFTVAINELKVKSQEEQKKIQESVKEDRRKEQELITKLSTTLQDKIIKSGEVGNFLIPAKDRTELYNAIADKIQFTNGRFYMVKEYTEADIDQEIQAEFFKLKKGNLADFINTKANSLNTNRLKNTINKEKNSSSSSQLGGKGRNGSLKDLDE